MKPNQKDYEDAIEENRREFDVDRIALTGIDLYVDQLEKENEKLEDQVSRYLSRKKLFQSTIKDLEREKASLKRALEGRTVSCEACNHMGQEKAKLTEKVKEYELILEEIFKCEDFCLCDRCRNLTKFEEALEKWREA